MFNAGDYIVLLNTPNFHTQYPPNYIFKQKTPSKHLMSELDCEGNTRNGGGGNKV
jgi:hypothetical protein